MKFIEVEAGLYLNLEQIDKEETRKFTMDDIWVLWKEVTNVQG